MTLGRDDHKIENQLFCARHDGLLYTIEGERDKNLIYKNAKDSLSEMKTFYRDSTHRIVVGAAVIIQDGINKEGEARLQQDRGQHCVHSFAQSKLENNTTTL